MPSSIYPKSLLKLNVISSALPCSVPVTWMSHLLLFSEMLWMDFKCKKVIFFISSLKKDYIKLLRSIKVALKMSLAIAFKGLQACGPGFFRFCFSYENNEKSLFFFLRFDATCFKIEFFEVIVVAPGHCVPLLAYPRLLMQHIGWKYQLRLCYVLLGSLFVLEAFLGGWICVPIGIYFSWLAFTRAVFKIESHCKLFQSELSLR